MVTQIAEQIAVKSILRGKNQSTKDQSIRSDSVQIMYHAYLTLESAGLCFLAIHGGGIHP